MKNLNKLLIALISVAFIASGIFAQSDTSPKIKSQLEKPVKSISQSSFQVEVVATENAPTHDELMQIRLMNELPLPAYAKKSGGGNGPTDSFCAPTYSYGCSVGDGFTDFALEEIQNLSNGCANLNGTGWSEYYTLGPATLIPGNTHTFTMGTGYSSQHANIWIDFNDDEILTTDELILNDYILVAAGVLYDVDIAIPANAIPGQHAMRVMAVWLNAFTDPCGSYSFGEAEDYYVNVITPEYGILNGYVTKNTGGTPIQGATISVAGGNFVTTSAANGYYEFPAILTGTWPVTCTKIGYNPISSTVTIVVNQTTTKNFPMTAPTMNITPATINVIVDPFGTATELVNINNNGDGPLDWDANLELLTDGSKAPWDLQFSFDVTAASGAAGNAGAECDGQYYYTTRWASNLIHKYDLTGALIEEFSIPGVTGLRDLAFDGTYMYGGAAANTIYQMDFVTKTLVSTISSPQAVRSIAYDDGENGLWVANWDTDIALVNMSGATINTIPAATHGLGGMYGTAYDNWSSGSPYLWIFDQGAGAGSPQILYQADLNSITMTGFTHDVTADLPPNASAIAGGLFTIPGIYPGTVSLGGLIQGTPDVLFMLELAPFSTWISITPTSGNIPANNSFQMSVNFDAGDIPAGTVKTANIHFASDPEVGTFMIPVSMTVGSLQFGNITGTITLGGSLPYNNGNITDVLITAGPYSTSPGATGFYNLPVYPGTYDVVVTLYGYETQTNPGVVVGEGITVSGINFTLPCINGRILGTITDVATGLPIAGATVSIIDTEIETLTASDGTYEIFIEAGTYSVKADHPTYMAQLVENVIVTIATDIQLDFALSYQEVCQFSVVLWDDYGDGWNGGTLTISVDGVVVLNSITLATGTGPETHYFEVGTGLEVTCVFVAGGWPYECSYYIYNNDNEEVFADGVGGVEPTGGSFIASCIVFVYGDLAGTVTELGTGNPISGAEIMIDDMLGITGTDGTYLIEDVMIGTWNVYCDAEGYNPAMASGVVILEDLVTTQNFQLTEPQMVVTPPTVSVELEPNAQADETVNISNPGNGPIEWDASLVLLSEETKDPWDLQFNFDVTTASGAAGNAGAECDGEFYYTTRWASNLIHKYDLTGALIEEFSIPGVTGLRDLAFDGTYMYGGAAANTIYQMDFVTKTLISTISSPQAVRSIAYDEGQDGLWVANWDTDIALVNMSGATINTIPAATHGLGGMYGTAYDNYSSGGPYLWIFDQGAGAGSPQILYQADLNSITMTGFTHDVTADLPPNTSAIAGGLFTIPNVYPGTVSLGGLIQGTPDVLFMYELAAYSTWITIDPTSGTLTGGTNEDMNLHFDATDLLPGFYYAEIHFSTNPNVGSPVVNVTMHVQGLIPATNLNLAFDCTDVILTWEMPSGGNADSWNVYRDGALLGNVTAMTFTDEMVDPEVEYGYYVKAVYAGVESMPTATETITVPVPANLEANDLESTVNVPNENDVTLNWEAPNACLAPDGYNIYRDGNMINTTLVTALTYVDPELPIGLYEYYVTAIYYFGESDPSDPVYTLITGIEDMNSDLFRIYPNPVSEVVNIESAAAITGIRIFNNSGQTVMEKIVDVNQYQIDVSNYEKGIYYIKLETAEGNLIRKITVN